MTFQFLTGWLDRQSVSTSDNSEEMDAPTSICRIEQACAAFHTAHNSIVALTAGRDEFGVNGLPELRARRDAAFEQVRAHVAGTRSAVRAKVRVLIVMRDWFAVENPDVSAFAIEVALEAAALLDNDRGQECACQETQGETVARQSRAAGRRNPLAWLARSWGNATDTPFAN
ncbi:hypothetical protein [Acidisphaera sp. S103]|uniref:hypothetical protein n=1 Tax=Acidisphaera sp. S103 TaxID=1747223 RepID=UPI00131D8695|nr:hypothetical protein [Acidisphaera sp. S103]